MNREEIINNLKLKYHLTEFEAEYLYMQLYFTDKLNSNADDEVNKLHEEQKKNRDEILNRIARILLSHTIKDSIMSISDSDRRKLQESINALINKKIQSEIKFEVTRVKELLCYTGQEKYKTNDFISGKSKPGSVNQDKLDKLINSKVDEKIWSDRLWTNKNQTAADLRKEIKKFLNGETSVNKIEGIIKEKYNSNGYNTKRLVLDNIARVQEGVNDIWRDEHGTGKVLYMATLCHKTCSRCSRYDGKEYSYKKIPVKLPQHPFCKCTYINLPYEGWKPNERYDNAAKRRTYWQDYEEWREKQ